MSKQQDIVEDEIMDWDERYSEPGFVYGTSPNGFLLSVVDGIPKGRILSLAEGEGRNAVYLASLGYEVTGVDGSEVGLRKAEELAAERGAAITTIHADLSEFEIEPEKWDGIIACYCHLPSAIRISLHQAAVRGLKPGGVFVLEAFRTAISRHADVAGGPETGTCRPGIYPCRSDGKGGARRERAYRAGIGGAVYGCQAVNYGLPEERMHCSNMAGYKEMQCNHRNC